ncbi:MAG: hypothetical protein QXI12_02320 [Candidatus Methanomethyliaceae archaeon]
MEEKNWSAVRKLVGYARYESKGVLALLRAIYANWRLLLDFFQPVRKLIAKERGGARCARSTTRHILRTKWC